MVQYIYKANIDFQDNADKTDFETNYKTTAKEFSSITVSDTVFTLELTYTNFKALIDGINITWADVRYIIKTTNNILRYELHFITNNPL